MTTKVTVSNDASSQMTITVYSVLYEKGKAGSRDFQQQHIAPGASGEFYMHSLMELRIEEIPIWSDPSRAPERKEER